MILKIAVDVIGEIISDSDKCGKFHGECEFSHENFGEISILTLKINVFSAARILNCLLMTKPKGLTRKF